MDPGDVRGWQIDHCHDSHKVRGILCRNCNLLLGYAKDSEGVLISATKYICKTSANDFVGYGISGWKPSPSALKKRKADRPLEA
jgi:hypothetical protein